ncbi:MAG: hypothetical protein U1A78_10535 [Polyangia bacterium]
MSKNAPDQEAAPARGRRRRAVASLLALPLAVAVGCDSSQTPGQNQQGVTFYKDVQPILRAKCESCHTPAGIAPFALDNYEHAKQYAPALVSAVQARRMPPWMPSADCQRFVGDRTLTQQQIDTLAAWQQAGTPEGNAADAPPVTPPPQGLTDASIELDWDVAYTPTKTDDYHCFILDPKLTQAKDLVAYEFIPDQRQEVHHALIYSADATKARAIDDAAPGLGWPCGGGSGVDQAVLVATWVPGTPVIRYPAGTAISIQSGNVLIAQMHYNTANGATPDLSRMRLKWADQSVLNKAAILPVLNTTFQINPGQMGATADAVSKPLQVGLRVWGLMPHMHQLGRSGRVEAAGQCLINIPKWDFHWQQMYFFDNSSVYLPAGSVVKYTCTWDNTTANTIRWGEGTADEMCIAYFYTTLL